MKKIVNKIKKAVFKFSKFSNKQLQVLTWWMPTSPVKEKDGIIADGSIRSGKTLSMSLSYVIWAMETFEFQNFGMCGKTIGSFRRNVLFWLKLMLKSRGYKVEDLRSDNLIIITRGKVSNYFYIFGGKDERSQDLIQGITLAGCFFDEVALMPQSFVNQATGRCSVDGSKFWFNCNPDGPYHWFKLEWIDKRKEKNILYLHFTMEDNLSLSERVKERYRKMYSGVFFKRYILGLWVMAEGIIFDMFNEDVHKKPTIDRKYTEYYVSCDYGTQNATVFILWGKCKGIWYAVKEYCYSGREENKQKTDEEYYEDLEEFLGDIIPKAIIIDPSAASFIATIKKKGKYNVKKANNDVLDGIRNVGTALTKSLIIFNDCCVNCFREFFSYIWDEKAVIRGEDKPIKENDHCMDAVRYFVNTILFKGINVVYDEEIYKKGMGLSGKQPVSYKKGGSVF
ncbi:PBSX family phage terminase large subunit [Clostridium gasigenes]|uniref:PBSX family phage terminase large subunit n=1 Tax=Clostridium gasigenes TaxID=94869 RepID=UPI0016233C76|nr:PBSX family phage terminase large subunit [Clostridium gasigenes]MBB6625250.1 PBSX family phage terminase large subunit [Clostridium gasigenes]